MTELLALAAVGVLLVVAIGVTARRPAAAPPDRDGYFTRWSALHGGYDPRTGSRMLRGWLTGVHALALPLARAGVLPDLVTLSSAWVAGLVVALAGVGGHWALAAGMVLVLGGLLDNLDGCLAVLEDRTTRWGYVLDSVVDRVADALFLVAVVVVGCPVWLAVATGFGCFLLEYLRARAGNAGGGEVGRITVGERPTRVIVLAAALLGAGALPGHAAGLVTLGCAVLLALTAVSLAQLSLAVRTQLAD